VITGICFCKSTEFFNSTMAEKEFGDYFFRLFLC
jgi:hypothetical protein